MPLDVLLVTSCGLVFVCTIPVQNIMSELVIQVQVTSAGSSFLWSLDWVEAFFFEGGNTCTSISKWWMITYFGSCTSTCVRDSYMYMHVYTSYNFMQSFTQIIELEKSSVCLSRTSRFSCWASNFLLSNGQGKLSPTKKSRLAQCKQNLRTACLNGKLEFQFFWSLDYLVLLCSWNCSKKNFNSILLNLCRQNEISLVKLTLDLPWTKVCYFGCL